MGKVVRSKSQLCQEEGGMKKTALLVMVLVMLLLATPALPA
jgi:hypothetical protein